VGCHMSISKLAAGLLALALGAAVVTALAGATPEVKADLTPAVADLTPAAVKGDLTLAPAKAERPASGPVGSACPKEPWPYGCQWRERPARRVLRSTRPL
jgi:hypothetical protein